MVQFKPTIRLATSEDAEKICDLFNRVSPAYERGVDFWLWINRLLSQEKSIIAVAEIEEVVIGHYAIIPQEIVVEDLSFNVGFGIQAVIDPAKSGLVSIFEITNLAYKRAKEVGLKFIYGFPNKNYRLIQEKIERWEKVELFNAYEISINNYPIKDEIDLNTIIKINNPNDFLFEISKILDKMTLETKWHIDKNLIYYKNRYFHHPHSPYSSYILKDLSGNKACIYLKRFTEGNTKKGHLIDFIKEDEFAIENLLDVTVTIFKKEGVDLLSLWPVDKEIKQILENKKLTAIGFDTFFAIKFLDKDFNNRYRDLLLNFDNWRLLMGDSDAF
jgi:hypothetical protein